jgi:hypothetical protein
LSRGRIIEEKKRKEGGREGGREGGVGGGTKSIRRLEMEEENTEIRAMIVEAEHLSRI